MRARGGFTGSRDVEYLCSGLGVDLCHRGVRASWAAGEKLADRNRRLLDFTAAGSSYQKTSLAAWIAKNDAVAPGEMNFFANIICSLP